MSEEQKNFSEEIYKKKEFYINKIDKVEGPIDLTEMSKDGCSGFKLSKNQKFLKNFISTNTPYNSILLYHGTGVGKNLPEITLAKSELEKGINILDLLSSKHITTSKSEGRRAIQGNGIKINDELVSDEKKIIDYKLYKDKNYIKVSYGKKKHYIIKVV